jgi:hypothetical protein
MAKKGDHRGHVLGDRLWDSDGDVWFTVLGTWVEEAEVDQLLREGVPVVVHGFGRPFRTLSPSEARHFWTAARHHFGAGAEADREGLVLGAQVWAREGQRLLGFVEYC